MEETLILGPNGRETVSCHEHVYSPRYDAASQKSVPVKYTRPTVLSLKNLEVGVGSLPTCPT